MMELWELFFWIFIVVGTNAFVIFRFSPFLKARIKNLMAFNKKTNYGVLLVIRSGRNVEALVGDFTTGTVPFDDKGESYTVTGRSIGNLNSIPFTIHTEDDMDALPVFKHWYAEKDLYSPRKANTTMRAMRAIGMAMAEESLKLIRLLSIGAIIVGVAALVIGILTFMGSENAGKVCFQMQGVVTTAIQNASIFHPTSGGIPLVR